jgi:hypothetical protein
VKEEACYPGVIFEVFKCPVKVFREGKTNRILPIQIPVGGPGKSIYGEALSAEVGQ